MSLTSRCRKNNVLHFFSAILILSLLGGCARGIQPLDSFWIEALRDFNAELEPDEQLGVFFLDMDLWVDSFQESLHLLSREVEQPELTRATDEILALIPGSRPYQEALESL